MVGHLDQRPARLAAMPASARTGSMMSQWA